MVWWLIEWLTVDWLLTDCLKIWARKMKTDWSRQLTAEGTDGRTDGQTDKVTSWAPVGAKNQGLTRIMFTRSTTLINLSGVPLIHVRVLSDRRHQRERDDWWDPVLCAQDVTCPAATFGGKMGFVAPIGNQEGTELYSLKDLVEACS